MAVTEERVIEEQTAEPLEEGTAEVPTFEEEERVEFVPRLRFSIAVAFVILAAAVMVGGVFSGIIAYFWAALAGVLGIAVASGVVKIRRISGVLITAVLGIFSIGLLVVAFSGNISDVFAVGARASEAARSGEAVRPPVEFTAGWRAITGWLMGAIGFGAGWVALELKKAGVALLVPLPLVAMGAISVPKGSQVASGLVAVGFFAVALGVLSGAEITGDQRPSMAFEVRRTIRALPLVLVIIGALYGLAKLDILFPDPIFDPTQQAQRPKVVPLSQVEDRVLFTVESKVTGPWRMGLLDVYDGRDWRLPPFAETRLREVPQSGIVNSELTPEERAAFVVKELGGAVLPGLPNSVGIVAEGPRLAYDTRTGNIRAAEGQIEDGLAYTVVAARIPTVDELKNISGFPKEVQRFLEIPDPPPAVEDLLSRAPNTSLWERLDFMRLEFLKTVVAEGAGTPVPVPPSRVHDMIAGTKRGTPFEIVAAQAMMARWAGVPSRIGYGFDGGDKVSGLLEVRPKHGTVFLEVYFTGYGWLPVLGNPLQAASSLGGTPKNVTEGILPSDDISVPLLVAIQVDPSNYLFDQVRAVLAVMLPIVLALLLAYYSWPAVRKTMRKSRRRTWAKHEGPYARVAVAYAELRDTASDFGYLYPSDTPIMFLDRVTQDEEHTELVWLVTRVLWGDLQNVVSSQDALAAEELSRSLIKRLKVAHSYTLRLIAAVSRVSLRNHYAPRLQSKVRRRSVTEKAA